MGRTTEINEEICLFAQQLKDNVCELHYHKSMEIYCVLEGSAIVTVCGERKLLTAGQLVIIEPYENHDCEAVGESDVLAVRIGMKYYNYFVHTYPDKKFPRWLMKINVNGMIQTYIRQKFVMPQEEENELWKTGVVCQLLAIVIDSYGLSEREWISDSDRELVAEIVQYIYNHSSEKVTLEELSKQFYLSPTFLSKKLKKRIGVDFRVFVNDIRVCRVIRMLNEPESQGRKIEEIAADCGFTSMSTFCRCYKRNHVGRNTK